MTLETFNRIIVTSGGKKTKKSALIFHQSVVQALICVYSRENITDSKRYNYYMSIQNFNHFSHGFNERSPKQIWTFWLAKSLHFKTRIDGESSVLVVYIGECT